MLVFHERDEIHLVVASDHEDALASVAVGVRVLEDVEQAAALDVEDDVLEPDTALRNLSFAFFASSQSKYFSGIQGITMCAS